MIAKAISVVITFAVTSVVIGFLYVMWGAFGFPTMVGFNNYILPSVVGLHDVPIIGTFLSVILWVISFEYTMFVSKLIIWLWNIWFNNNAGESLIR